MRDTRGHDQTGKVIKRPLFREAFTHKAFILSHSTRSVIVIPADRERTTCPQRACRGQTRPPQTQNRNLLARKALNFNHVSRLFVVCSFATCTPASRLPRNLATGSNHTSPKLAKPGYRTFKVARPIIARIKEMIQKRITICGSAQPFFS
jgi:hypothetical protein